MAIHEGREPVYPERPPPAPEEVAEAGLSSEILRAIDAARHAQQIALCGDRLLTQK